jgi:hypothetical protein
MVQALFEHVSNDVSVFHWDALKGKRIAIVGNAHMQKAYGEAIDSHDVVIRCNKWLFSPEMNPEITGEKTHICFAWALSVLMNKRFKSILARNSEIVLVAPFSFSDQEVALNKLAAYLGYKNRVNYIADTISDRCTKLVPPKSRPSTWFIASNIALQQSPWNVDLYWFTFSDFNRIENKRSYTTQHSFQSERDYILKCQNSWLISVHEQ